MHQAPAGSLMILILVGGWWLVVGEVGGWWLMVGGYWGSAVVCWGWVVSVVSCGSHQSLIMGCGLMAVGRGRGLWVVHESLSLVIHLWPLLVIGIWSLYRMLNHHQMTLDLVIYLVVAKSLAETSA